MPNEAQAHVTQLLHRWRDGEQRAYDELVTLVYPQLRALAGRCISGEQPGHTLSATALVHEAYLRIVGAEVEWADRVHFFSIAARVMRRILVDHAKSKATGKRGAGAAKVPVDEAVPVTAAPEAQILDVHEALDNLAQVDRRKADLVELIYFGGLSYPEAAAALGISEATVHRELRLAKAWLHSTLESE
jgi:RNA polymerase sigma factor (TIGR02999 family)